MPDELKLLLIEDVETDAKLIEHELKRAGLRTIARRVETEAGIREQLGRQVPDAILADFTMPHLDGLTALALSRSLAPDVPFIFVSGTMGEDNAIRALKAGATDYVLKDNLVRLPPTVERSVREARERILARRRESEDKKLKSLIAGIVDLMTTPFVVTDTEAIIQIINPAFTKAFGWSFAELAGKDVRQIAADENVGMFQELARTGGPQPGPESFESYLRNKKGELLAVRFSTRSIRVDGEPKARIAFVDYIDSVPDPSEARPALSRAKFDRGAAELAERTAKLKGVVAGRIRITGLEAAAIKFKDNWGAKRRRIMDTALAIIGRNLGPRDLVSEEDDGFLLAFFDVTEQEADLTCRAVEMRVNEFLFGEIGLTPAQMPQAIASAVKIATISAGDILKFGSFGLAMEEKLGTPVGLALPSMREAIEADVQRRRERLVGDLNEVIGKAVIRRYEIDGPKGPAPDVDCLDFDPATIEFLLSNIDAIEAQEGLKSEGNLVRLERVIGGLIAGEFGPSKKHHLSFMTIDVLRDQATRRKFLTLWRLVPTDVQKRIILCFQDVDGGLAPVAVESAILQVAGLVFATGIVLVHPVLPALNLQLIKSRLVVLDTLAETGVSDQQWSNLVRPLRQKGCKVFLRARAGDASKNAAARIGVDGLISVPFTQG